MKLNRGVLGVVLSIILAGLSWFAIAAVMPPQPVASDAPATAFSAERAYEHVKVVSENPHPTGSASASEVREYIVEQLRELGLDPQVQESVGASGNLGAFAMAKVQNVVATIKGTDSSGTLYLMTHYDSVA